MTWFKVDDSLAFHEKVVLAGNSAMGLWVRAGAWCSQQLTDGYVRAHMVPSLGTPAQAAALVRVGLWLEEDDGYRFHDWAQANPMREQVQAERDAARERMRSARVRRSSGEQPPNFGDGSPTPTRPDPSKTKTSSLSARKRASSVPDIFPITDEMKAWGRQNAALVRDPEAETRQFLDHHRAKGSTFKDWTAAWRTWMGNAQKFAAGRGRPEQQTLAPSAAWLENM